jgi:hypothetical protein
MKAKLDICWTGRACPVQAEGTVNGVPFYFRARGQRWSMSIGEDPVGISVGRKEGWRKSEPWGEEMYDAGWMPDETAKEIIEKCAEEYWKEINEQCGVVNEN